jgi:hypothetical protein
MNILLVIKDFVKSMNFMKKKEVYKPEIKLKSSYYPKNGFKFAQDFPVNSGQL